MGSSNRYCIQSDPCANCGRHPGALSSSVWNHGELVCSDACGLRLHKKIEGGMLPRPAPAHPPDDSERIYDLRLRIKVLEGRLRIARERIESAYAQGRLFA